MSQDSTVRVKVMSGPSTTTGEQILEQITLHSGLVLWDIAVRHKLLVIRVAIHVMKAARGHCVDRVRKDTFKIMLLVTVFQR